MFGYPPLSIFNEVVDKSKEIVPAEVCNPNAKCSMSETQVTLASVFCVPHN